MKKILITIISLLLLPSIAHASIAVGWNATSTDKGYIQPTTINGNSPWVQADHFVATSTTATSNFLGNVMVGNAIPFIPNNGLFGETSNVGVSANVNDLFSNLDLANINQGAFATGGISFINGATNVDQGFLSEHDVASIGFSSNNFNSPALGGPVLPGLPPNSLGTLVTDGGQVWADTSANYASSSMNWAIGPGFAVANIDMTLNDPNPALFPGDAYQANLGLGTTTPYARLSILASSTSQIPYLEIASTTNGTPNNPGYQSPIFVVANNGYVLVGTSTSNHLFTVYAKNDTLVANTTADPAITVVNGSHVVGTGETFAFQGTNTSGSLVSLGHISSISTSLTAGSEGGSMNFYTRNLGNQSLALTLAPNGTGIFTSAMSAYSGTFSNGLNINYLSGDQLLYENNGAVLGVTNVTNGLSFATFSGGSIGTLGLNTASLLSNGLVAWNGSNLAATGTPTLTVGSLIATTTATSTFGGGINISNGCYAIAGTCLSTGGAGTNYFTNSGSNTYLSTGSNLGVGTSSPWATLSVGIPTYSTTQQMFAIGSSTSVGTTSAFLINNNAQAFFGTSTTASTYKSGLAVQNTTVAGNIASFFSHKGTPEMYLDNTGDLTVIGGLTVSGGTVSMPGNVSVGTLLATTFNITQIGDNQGNPWLVTDGDIGGGDGGDLQIGDSNGQYDGQILTLCQAGGDPTYGFCTTASNTAGVNVNNPVYNWDVNGDIGNSTGGNLVLQDHGGNVGIGATSTPFYQLSVIGQFAVASSTAGASNRPTFWIDGNGHEVTSGPYPRLSSCGTSPSFLVPSNDHAMVVEVGSVTASGCTITFAHPYASRPVVQVTNESMSVVNALSVSVSNTAITISQTALTGDVLDITVTGTQ